MLSGPLQGRLLSLFSHLLRPKKILEIGTFTGYATLCLAEGLDKKGVLHTIDCNEELIHFQQKYFTKSTFKNNIQAHLGNALEVLPKLEGPFDLVFIDADKVNYETYFEQVLP
jgi:predicted O-methyltransferase YrrM